MVADAKIMKGCMEEEGATVSMISVRQADAEGIVFNDDAAARRALSQPAYANLFVEASVPAWLMAIAIVTDTVQNWLLVNQELTNAVVEAHRMMDVIFCKTHHGFEVMNHFRKANKLDATIIYLGFTSMSKLPTSNLSADFNEVLHVAGKSWFKQTGQILRSWLKHPEFPVLTVLCTCPQGTEDYCCINRHLKPIEKAVKVAPNINIIDEHIENDQLLKLQTRIGVHLCPSATEGFGHYINEARALARVVITTDGAPMNELVDSHSGILVKPKETKKFGKLEKYGSQMSIVDDKGIDDAITEMLNLSILQRQNLGLQAQKRFVTDEKRFYLAFTEFLGNASGNLPKAKPAPLGKGDIWHSLLGELPTASPEPPRDMQGCLKLAEGRAACIQQFVRPQTAPEFVQKGNILWLDGHHQAARNSYQDALDLDPTFKVAKRSSLVTGLLHHTGLFENCKDCFDSSNMLALPAPKSTAIPKTIHILWLGKSPLPESVNSWTTYYCDINKEWTVKVWRDSDVETFSLQNQAHFEACGSWAGKADIARLEILARLGGFYVVSKVKCIGLH